MGKNNEELEINLYSYYMEKYLNEISQYSDNIETVLDYIKELTKLTSGLILIGKGDSTPLNSRNYEDLFTDFVNKTRISLKLAYAYGMEFAHVFQKDSSRLEQELKLEYSINPYQPMLFNTNLDKIALGSYVMFVNKLSGFFESGYIDKEKYDQVILDMNEFYSKAIHLCYKGGIHIFRETQQIENS
jgi:hypothetical protein